MLSVISYDTCLPLSDFLHLVWYSLGPSTLVAAHDIISFFLMAKAMATHPSALAWRIPGTEEPGGLQSMGSRRVDTTERLHFHFSLSCIREGNGSPLQCSCLENPRDGGAWWAAVCGVAQSRTRLKWLGSSSSSWGIHCIHPPHRLYPFFCPWTFRLSTS